MSVIYLVMHKSSDGKETPIRAFSRPTNAHMFVHGTSLVIDEDKSYGTYFIKEIELKD